MPHAVTNSTPKTKKERWLTVFRDSGNVRLACFSVGIDRTLAYKWRERDPKFAEEWSQAEEDASDLLEAEALKRAKASSDTLLIFLLKARRPEKYRETVNLNLMHKFAKELEEKPDADLLQELGYDGPDSSHPATFGASGGAAQGPDPTDPLIERALSE